MPIEWPNPTPLAADQFERMKPAFKQFGIGDDSFLVTEFPFLTLQASGRFAYMGKAVLVRRGGSAPVALARGAFGRWFPEISGPEFAGRFDSQLDWLREQRNLTSDKLSLRPAYLVSPATSDYCAALFTGPATNVHGVVRMNAADKTMRFELAGAFVAEAREFMLGREARIRARNQSNNFPSN